MLNIDPGALDFALAHVTLLGDTDVVPQTHEIEIITEQWESLRNYLTSTDLDQWQTRPTRTYLGPKRLLSYRILTQLDILDTLLVTALVYELGQDIENERVPTSQQIVHSHRFSPNERGRLYDPNWKFRTFRERSLELAKSSGEFVLKTDIADFYLRIYLHRIENSVQAATSKSDHSRVFIKMLKGWNSRVSYGLPIGPAAFRLISEIAINDIDMVLIDAGLTHCRYSDDYRIFTKSEGDARQACALLARALHSNHGLTLQESKTEILSSESFCRRFERSETDQARDRMSDRFGDLLDDFQSKSVQLIEDFSSKTEPARVTQEVPSTILPGDISFAANLYGIVDYEELDEETKEKFDELNLWGLVKDEVEKEKPIDVGLVSFALKRLRYTSRSVDIGYLLDNLEALYPLFAEVMQLISAQTIISEPDRVKAGNRLLDLLDDPMFGALEAHRAWILHVFANPAWNQAERISRLWDTSKDPATRCGIINALAAANRPHWFRSRRTEVISMQPWERRAFLAGARVLAKDEAGIWYRTIKPRLDPLERAIVDWSTAQL